VNAMAGMVEARQQEVANLKRDLAAAQQQVAQAIEEKNQEVARREKQAEEIRADVTKAAGVYTSAADSNTAAVADVTKNFDAAQASYAETTNKLNTEIQNRDTTIARQLKEIEILRTKLGLIRPPTDGPIIRDPDGRIARIPGNGIVFIDLGAGDHITPGMTFEVYDKNEGVPGLPAAADDATLPEGKASIEVTRVGATASEARIVKQRRGTQLTEGDLINNLVYNPNTTFKFVVFGNFDMDQNNVATPGDAEIVKRLVTQWGGNLQDQVNVDTDFLVLGKEPVLPIFTPEELDDASNKAKYDAAVREADEYTELRGKAQQLNIPILNQNRFLYYVGYFDQSNR
ncbi:MAG: hypothetical protein ACREIT_06030, partial [Tepidisphaeraceae bacterium]